MTEKKLTLLRRDNEFDIFTDGHKIFAGVLEKGKMVYGAQIGDLDISMSSRQENDIRKKVAKAREFKPVKLLTAGVWDEECKEVEIVGCVWDYGMMSLIASDGEEYSLDDLYQPNDKSKAILEIMKRQAKVRERAMAEIQKLEEELVPFKANFIRDILAKTKPEGEEDE